MVSQHPRHELDEVDGVAVAVVPHHPALGVIRLNQLAPALNHNEYVTSTNMLSSVAALSDTNISNSVSIDMSRTSLLGPVPT